MGEDLSTGIKIAITLIILCSIMAIVFALLCVMKNMTSVAVNEFQAGTDGIQQLYWEDYNQKVVTGNQVQSVIKQCYAKNIAVVVRTTRSRNDLKGGVNYGVALAPYTSTLTLGSGSTVYYYPNDITSTPTYMEDYTDSDINTIKYDSKASVYRASMYRASNSTEIVYRTNTKSAFDNTSTVYINPLHDYNAYLIKDATGMNVGMFFDQKG